MGEAVKRLSEELRESSPDIPWRQIAGFRDVLIHDYMRVDIGEVWAVIEHSLPVVKPRIAELLDQPPNIP